MHKKTIDTTKTIRLPAASMAGICRYFLLFALAVIVFSPLQGRADTYFAFIRFGIIATTANGGCPGLVTGWTSPLPYTSSGAAATACKSGSPRPGSYLWANYWQVGGDSPAWTRPGISGSAPMDTDALYFRTAANDGWDQYAGGTIGRWVQCPGGGTTLWNGSQWTCVNAPSCAAGQVRSPTTGKCGISAKNLGTCDACSEGKASVGNPVNAGAGTKFQVEPIYRGSGALPLLEQLSYNSQPTNYPDPVWAGAYGKGWKGYHERKVTIASSVAVNDVARVARPDGKTIDFRKPTTGNVYIADADIADRLERLTDGSGNTTGWKYTVAANDSTEQYDAVGKLLSITNRAGVTLTLAYSTSSTPPSIAPVPGLLITVSDPWGRALNYVYNVYQRVTRMTDPAGGTYDFTYDANGNLATITFPDTKVRTYVYNEPANTQNTNLPYALTGIIDENASRFATYQYDTQGRAVSTEHAGGAGRVTLDYVSTGVSTTVTDVHGVARTYGFSTVQGVIKTNSITGQVCPSCGPASQTYDANGNAATRTDWNGNRTNYTYDLARNLETQRVEGLTSGGGTTPETRTISTEWHATFRLPTRVAEPLRITTNTYDPDGTQCGARGAVCSRSIQATTDANGSQGFSATQSGSPRTWTYTYNSAGQVLTVNGPRTDVSDVTTYTYDTQANLATITNAVGHVTNITSYNAHGQPLTIVDPNGLTTTLVYDARQRLTSRTVGGEATTYDYDDAGQLTKVTLPDGAFLSYGYDAAHRLNGIQDNLGNRIAYTLDLAGNRTQEQVYDPANALAQTRSRVYSSLNRLFQELGAQSQTTEYGYDDQGNVTSVKDPLNHTTSSQYDPLNRLKQVTDPALGVTLYGYNGLDALTSVSDPRTLVTSYTLDGLGNLTQQASPDTGNTGNTYDTAGNLATQTDAKGQATAYAYDALNRVTLITFHDGSRQIYGYDSGANALGRLTSIEERDPANALTGQTTYAYDQKGRVSSETRTIAGIAYTTGYRYDSFGRRDRVTYPSGRTVDYSFDTAGRVSTVTTTPSGGSAQTLASGITYHPFGGVKGYTLGNGQTYARSYDQDGRISSYTLGAAQYALGYDAASRIEFINETGNPANSNTYGYDALDRLTSAAPPSSTYGYSYDAVGNRLTRSTGGNTDAYAYSTSSNRIASITPQSGPVRSFTFDANGSTTADGVNTYAYDTRGRMVQATSSLGVTNYQVNALGQRVRKTNSLGDTVFHYDTAGHLIAETTAAGAALREYAWLGDIPIAVAVAGGVNYIHVDHLNTPRLVADAAGTTVWKWDQQEPFGNNPADENPGGLGTFDLPLRLPGQYADKETNLHYNYFRDYDPSIGRYGESDPIGLVGGLNTFAYANLSPLKYDDPEGLFAPAAAAAVEALVTVGGAIMANEARKKAESAAIPGTTPNNAPQRGRGKWKVLARCEVRRINDCCDWPKDKPWVYGIGMAVDYWVAEKEAADAANDALRRHRDCFKGHCHPIRCWYNGKPARCLRFN